VLFTLSSSVTIVFSVKIISQKGISPCKQKCFFIPTCDFLVYAIWPKIWLLMQKNI
jgi:putative component of membrane protein insertase Oxa1/YidC/SpoIIIJ protein YidD